MCVANELFGDATTFEKLKKL